MLQHLSIRNYALIESLDIDFSEGLTIITGETGAGKSILLGALSLLIGNRADTSTLRDKTKKCIVEAQFNIEKYGLQSFFEKNELDFLKVSTLRREINPAGASRAFVNDTPVNLAQLKEIGLALVDVHSQHQSISLNEAAFQINMVDVFSGHLDKLKKYQTNFTAFKKLKQQLQDLETQDAQAKKELDFFQFQFNELEEANLKADEQETIEKEAETLRHAESITKALNTASFALSQSESTALSFLLEVKNLLAPISKYHNGVFEITQRINSAYIELKDISAEIDSLEQEINVNPSRLEAIENRLSLIYRLQQKHRVKTIEDLKIIEADLAAKILAISNLDLQISNTKLELENLLKSLLEQSEELSKKRKAASQQIEKQVRSLLAELGMPNAALGINISAAEDFNFYGKDRIQFLFSANKGSEIKELSKVASGGELSRLLLSLKSLLAQSSSLPTIIFDEIDTGVSGEVANKVGNILEKMANEMQVISITHLPQIASKGKEHWYVYKDEAKEKTLTHIKKLNKQERVNEIAQMLSSKTPTAAAISNAKELLKQ